MNGVSKITVTEDISLVNFKIFPRSVGCLPHHDRIFRTGHQHRHDLPICATGETADVSFTIDSKDLVRTLSIVQRFRVQYPNVRPSVSSGCCKIQLYGEEMRARPGVAAQAFRLVSEQTGDIRLITTSEVDISILIAEHDLPAVLENLRAFFQV